MSVRWITWAWDQQCSTPGEKLTLIALADHAGEDGTCFPGTGRLSEKTDQGNSTVRRHLTNLEERGLIERDRRRRDDGTLSTYLYQLGQRSDQAVDQRSDRAEPALESSGNPALTHERAEPSVSTNRQKNRQSLDLDADFDAFWANYPRTTAKPRARKAWKTATAKSEANVILSGLSDWIAFWRASGTEERFIPHPSTWLNGECWNDTPPTAKRSKAMGTLDRMARGELG